MLIHIYIIYIIIIKLIKLINKFLNTFKKLSQKKIQKKKFSEIKINI